MNCPKCQSENIETGKFMSGAHSMIFYLITEKLFSSRQSTVSATVCLDCGSIFDLKVDKLKKLKK